MARFQITSPDGQRFEINAPDGATDADVMAYARKQWKAAPAGPNPAEDFGGLPLRPFGIDTGLTMPQKLSNSLAGAGKAGYDIARGAGQWLGMVDKADVAASNRRDKPLMDTTAGVVGNVVGNVAAALPTAVIPGANTYAGAAAISGAMGLLTPSEEGRAGQLKTGALGAAIGPGTMLAGRGAVALGKGSKALAEPFYERGRQAIAGRTLERFADNPVTARASALGAQELVPGSRPTLAEATLDPGLAQLQRAAQSADPRISSALALRGLDQNAARVGALRPIAGDEATLAAARQARETATDPLRRDALSNANLGTTKTVELEGRIGQKNDAIISAMRDQGRFVTTQSQQNALAQDFSPVLGMPRFPGRYTHNIERAGEAGEAAGAAAAVNSQRRGERSFLEYQLNSLKEYGYSPLSAQNVTGGIEGVLNQPGIRASDVARGTLTDIREKLASLADKAGHIDARDLYTVRKEIGNTISKHAKESANWDKRLTAGLERDVQRSIDAAIAKAGAGDLWARYLTKYQDLSAPISRMQIGQELLKRGSGSIDDARGNPQLFASKFGAALKSPDTLAQSATGFDKAQLRQIMGPDMRTILNVQRDLTRTANADKIGKSVGSNTAQNLASQNIMRQLFGPLGMPQSFGESALLRTVARPIQYAFQAAEPNVQATLANALLDPKVAAALMMRQQPSAMGMLAGQGERYLPALSMGLLPAYRDH